MKSPCKNRSLITFRYRIWPMKLYQFNCRTNLGIFVSGERKLIDIKTEDLRILESFAVSFVPGSSLTILVFKWSFFGRVRHFEKLVHLQPPQVVYLTKLVVGKGLVPFGRSMFVQTHPPHNSIYLRSTNWWAVQDWDNLGQGKCHKGNACTCMYINSRWKPFTTIDLILACYWQPAGQPLEFVIIFHQRPTRLLQKECPTSRTYE